MNGKTRCESTSIHFQLIVFTEFHKKKPKNGSRNEYLECDTDE